MNDYDLKHVKLSEDNRISQYSSQGFKKGLELARKISRLKTDIVHEDDCNLSVRYSSKKIWKCVGTILNYCPSSVWHVAISPDGQILVVLSDDETGIDIWDIKSQTLINRIICNVDFESRFEITPDSKNIIIVECDQISTRSLQSGALLSSKEYKIEYNNVQADYLQSLNDKTLNQSILMNSELFDSYAIAISPGLNLVASHYENTITIWNIKTGKILHTLESKINTSAGLYFSYDFPILMTFDEVDFQRFEIWNPIEGKLVEENLYENKYGYGGSAISYDGLLLIRNCRIYDFLSGSIINDFTDDCYFLSDDSSQILGENLFSYSTSSSFSKDNETIVIAGGKGAIIIFKYLPVDEILASDPKNQESRITLTNKLIVLANKQCELGNHQEAIESYTTALKIDSNNSEAYNRRSTARSAIGDYQGAMEDLQQVRMIL
jgi:WD40 repeat protein